MDRIENQLEKKPYVAPKLYRIYKSHKDKKFYYTQNGKYDCQDKLQDVEMSDVDRAYRYCQIHNSKQN